MADPIYVSASVDNESERSTAKRLLQDVTEYPGIVEGHCDSDVLAELEHANISVVVLSGLAEVPEPTPLRRSKRNDDSLKQIAEQMEQLLPRNARTVLESVGGVVAESVNIQSSPEVSILTTAAVAAKGIFGGLTRFVRGEKDEDAYRLALLGSLRPEVEQALAVQGIAITSFRGGAFQVFLTPPQRAWLQQQSFVEQLDRYSLLDTVHTTLLVLMKHAAEKTQQGEPQLFELMLHRPKDAARVQRLIRQLAGKSAIVEAAPYAIRFRARIDPAMLAALADLPWVSSLLPVTTATLYSDRAREVIGLAPPGVPFPWTGEGERVAVIDSGIDRDHPDFGGQLVDDGVISFDSCPVDDLVGHGTHVAGIIAGTGAAALAGGGPPISGMAPGAKLVVVANVKLHGTRAEPIIPPDVTALFDLALKRKAFIINVSWGRTEAHGVYDGTADSIDRYVHEHPEVLVVVAAGNEGQALDGSWEFNTVTTPGSAKNVLTIGACATSRQGIGETWGERLAERFPEKTASDDPVAGDPDVIAGLSARGPTEFESIKPDLVAPGTYILAPRSKRIADPRLIWRAHTSDSYVFIGGTSMAAPVVSGAAAVLRHYLRSARGMATPSAALLKAILISAATPITSRRNPAQAALVGFPDFDQGFGRLDLSKLLPAVTGAQPARALAVVDVAAAGPRALSNKIRRSYSAFVREGGSGPLVITLVWTDVPGKDVQNRLTLRVTGPGGPYTGNANHQPNAASLLHPTAGDRRNTVQQVRIADAQPGEYTITVTGLVIIHAPQSFALAVVGDLKSDQLLAL